MDLSSQEHEDKMDNPIASPNDGFYGGQSPVMQNDTQIKRISSFSNDSSSEKTLRSTMKTIKLKKQIIQLKNKLEKSKSNSVVLKDEGQILRSELLSWVNRWWDLKVKKYKLKDVKTSFVSSNKKFLKRKEQYKIEDVKLSAKL